MLIIKGVVKLYGYYSFSDIAVRMISIFSIFVMMDAEPITTHTVRIAARNPAAEAIFLFGIRLLVI